jgi:protein-arginine deiminase
LPNLDFRADDAGAIERIRGVSECRNGSIGTSGITIWTQDWMQPAFMSMPSPDGQHFMWVWVRSSSRNPHGDPAVDPLRTAGRVVFSHLRGPDCAGVQHFDPKYVPADNRGEAGVYSAFDMCGNYGVIPPHTYDGHYYPQGRKIYGSTAGYTADPAFNAMLAAQGYQRPVVVDTSWLEVGHIDEFLVFVTVETERGWAMVIADPELGLGLLRDRVGRGHGEDLLFSGHPPPGARFPAVTIGDAVGADAIVRGMARARQGIENAVEIIRTEVGLDDRDIVRLPVLFKITERLSDEPVTPLLPDVVNLIGTGQRLVFAPASTLPR